MVYYVIKRRKTMTKVIYLNFEMKEKNEKNALCFIPTFYAASITRISVISAVPPTYANGSQRTMPDAFLIRQNTGRGKLKPISPSRPKTEPAHSRFISSPAVDTPSPNAISESGQKPRFSL